MFPEYLLRAIYFYYAIIRPGLATRRGLQRREGEWLKYWIVYSMFLCLCFWSDLLFGGWLPFYDELQVLLISCISLTSPHSSAWLCERLKSQFKIVDDFVQRFKQLLPWTALMPANEQLEQLMYEQVGAGSSSQVGAACEAAESVSTPVFNSEKCKSIGEGETAEHGLNEKLQRQELHD